MAAAKIASPKMAFSLLEVVFATSVFVLISAAVMSSLTFAMRSAYLNGDAFVAGTLARGFVEQMRADDFGNIGPEHYPDKKMQDPAPIYVDGARRIPCALDFRFSGFGVLSEATSSSLTDASGEWRNDEWAGSLVYLLEGQGAGQFAAIDRNTTHTLFLASPLTTAAGRGAKYAIGGGKTVEVTLSWRRLGKRYSRTTRSTIANARGERKLGL